MVFWGIGAGLGWILKPFPLRPPRSIAQRGKLIFLRSRKKERSGMASRKSARWLLHTPGKQKLTNCFNFFLCASSCSLK